MMSEHAPALTNVNSPQLSGPLIHVAEKKPVNRLQMHKIEISFERRFRKLKRTCRYKSCFRFFERGLIRYSEAVL